MLADPGGQGAQPAAVWNCRSSAGCGWSRLWCRTGWSTRVSWKNLVTISRLGVREIRRPTARSRRDSTPLADPA
ncbi:MULTISPECIES: hypothetical protein [unclassified Streptomyces]|uniref:hypothetical protein n=1 Tax=unclassified Streptomyces TaxID=2593676 RepID=UPI0033BF79A7